MPETPIDYDSVAEIYDLYVRADYDHAFFVAEAAKAQGPVLELTSGTGRLSLPLAEAGATLTCVDASQGMLAALKRKLDARGLEAELVCADICALSLEPRFQLAILPFQSFMELVSETRQRQALASARACLAPGGRFICTMHNPAVRRAQADGVVRVLGRFALPEGALVVSGAETGGDPVVERLQTFEFYDRSGVLTAKRLMPMRFSFIEADAFQAMAEASGFAVEALYGDYQRAAFDPACSPVMIWALAAR